MEITKRKAKVIMATTYFLVMFLIVHGQKIRRSPPSVQIQNVEDNLDITLHSDLSLVCEGEDFPSNFTPMKWMFIPKQTNQPIELKNDAKVSIKFGPRNSTLIKKDVNLLDEGLYECVINVPSENRKDSVNVIVTVPFFVNTTSPFVAAMETETVELKCTYCAKPDLNPQSQNHWMKNGEWLPDISRYKQSIIKGPDWCGQFILSVFHVYPNESGNYSCIAENPKGRASAWMQLSVVYREPSLRVLGDKVRDVIIGSNLTIIAQTPPWYEDTETEIHWSFNGGNGVISATSYKENYKAEERTSYNDTGGYMVLTIPITSFGQNGTYEIVAVFEYHMRFNNSISVIVKGNPTVDCGPPTIEALAGNNATISCTITGYPETSNIYWFHEAHHLSTNDKYKIEILNFPAVHVTSSLKIISVTTNDVGNYTCKVTNSLGFGSWIGVLNVASPQTVSSSPSSNTNTWNLPGSSQRTSPPNSGGSMGKSGLPPPTESPHVATIVGAICGVAALILVVVALCCYWKRKSMSKSKKNNLNYEYNFGLNTLNLEDLPSFVNLSYEEDNRKSPMKKTAKKLNTYTSLANDKMDFPRNRLQLGVDIGEGRFGKVIQARAQNIRGNGKWELVAVKTYRPTSTDAEKEDLFQELEIMRKIPPHENVVKLLGFCASKGPLLIIMEHVSHGSLLSYLRKSRPSSRMSINSTSSFLQPRGKDLCYFALSIAKGMNHVAETGIIHRDLATRNILLSKDFVCKICDFGLARDVEGIDVYERTSKGPLPVRWLAPEALEQQYYTRKSDVWSYGVLLWEIVTLGATPYPGMSAIEVVNKVLNGICLQRPLHCREEMYDLMVQCWATEGDRRPSFAQIVTHLESLLDDDSDYFEFDDYEESVYSWMDPHRADERV